MHVDTNKSLLWPLIITAGWELACRHYCGRPMVLMQKLAQSTRAPVCPLLALRDADLTVQTRAAEHVEAHAHGAELYKSDA